MRRRPAHLLTTGRRREVLSMGLIQEKFLVVTPRRKAFSHEWTESPNARKAKGEVPPVDGGLNALPPGSDITDQRRADIRTQPRVMAGETDPSRDRNPEAVANGFKRLEYSPYEDEYSPS